MTTSASTPLSDDEELLFRQVHPSFVRDGRPSSQAFRPTAKDEGKLSVARGSLTTPAGAFEVHTTGLGLPSAGTWAVTVGECDAVAELRWSHIVPRWTYRWVIQTGPGGPNPVRVEGDVAAFGGAQYAEYMLCAACEQRIGNWETRVATMALQLDDTFPAFAGAQAIPEAADDEWTLADPSGLDVVAMERFACSVVWRASVSKTFPNVSLGGRYADDFAAYLLDDNAAVPANVRIILELYNTQAKPRIDRVVVARSRQRTSGTTSTNSACLGCGSA